MLANPAPSEPCLRVVKGFRPKRSVLDGYPELLTVKPHLMELTGQSAQAIRAAINKGQLPGCRIGRRLYAPKQAFIDYVESGGGL